MTKAALNALAYTYLTGVMPKYLHSHTWRVVYNCIESRGLRYTLKPECVAMVADHPQVLKLRELETDGWKIASDLGRRKVRVGIDLYRDLPDGKYQKTCVYPDGKQGRVWG